jgi:hypothetical protein
MPVVRAALGGYKPPPNEAAGAPPKLTVVAPVEPVPVSATVVPPVTGPSFGTAKAFRGVFGCGDGGSTAFSPTRGVR